MILIDACRTYLLTAANTYSSSSLSSMFSSAVSSASSKDDYRRSSVFCILLSSALYISKSFSHKCVQQLNVLQKINLFIGVLLAFEIILFCLNMHLSLPKISTCMFGVIVLAAYLSLLQSCLLVLTGSISAIPLAFCAIIIIAFALKKIDFSITKILIITAAVALIGYVVSRFFKSEEKQNEQSNRSSLLSVNISPGTGAIAAASLAAAATTAAITSGINPLAAAKGSIVNAALSIDGAITDAQVALQEQDV